VLLATGCSSHSAAGVGAGKGDASAPAPPAGGGDDASSSPPPEGEAGAALSAWEQGVATYYAADGTGNCSFDASPGDLMVAAMDAPEYDNSAVCGECVTVKGPNATITVRIVDQCPECEMGHLDLSQEAFAMIADVSQGRVPITWQVVACDVTGPVAYRFKEGSSQYWTAIQVRNSRLPVASLEWMTGGAWSMIPRQSYDYFVIGSGVGTTGPFQVRVTAAGGAQLVDTLPGVVAGTVVNGAAQFP
jgi:expansin (peptidoglycan-binding protein)